MHGRSAEARTLNSTAPAVGLTELSPGCRCALEPAEVVFGCLECGAPCCSACAIMLESVAYCRQCATVLLEATVVLKSGSFELH
jgi:hypothetical protein